MASNHNLMMVTDLSTHYKIVINTANKSKNEIEQIIYHQSYAFYGFRSQVKFPKTKFMFMYFLIISKSMALMIEFIQKSVCSFGL